METSCRIASEASTEPAGRRTAVRLLPAALVLAGLAVSVPAAGAAPPAAGATSPADLAALTEELRELTRSVQELVELLRHQTEGQRLGLWMQRIDLAQRRLAPLEQERRRLEADLDAVSEEENRLRALLSDLEAEAEEAAEGLPGQPAPDQAALRGELQLHLGALRRRRSNLETRLVELDNELVTRRRDLEDWEHGLDRRLAEGL